MEDSDAIRNLVAAYSLEADSRNAGAWAALFDQDGVLVLNEREQARGPAALQAWFAARTMPPGNHMVANLHLQIDGGEAVAVANFIAVGVTLTIGARGFYRSRFVKRDDVWKIREWRIEVA